MGLELLATTRINRAINALQDIRQLPGQYLWGDRISDVDAVDGEILARITRQVVAADIIPDGGKAVVRSRPPIALQETHIPNLKHGSDLNQETVNLLLRIANNSGSVVPSDFDTVDSYVAAQLRDLIAGVRAQRELIITGMLVDDYDYDRWGVKLSNLTWGMPSDLKVTPSTPWSTAASATPIADIQFTAQVAAEKYGIIFNRVTISRTDFNYMVNTTEFRNKSTLYAQFVLPTAGTFPVEDTAMMTMLAGRILNMTVEIYDAQTIVENSYGVRNYVRYQPLGKVILSNSSFDNDSRIWDFANGIVLETLMASLAGETASGPIGGFAGPQRGPVGYATMNDDMNPPNISIWAVQRGFPRKFELAANAVLTVT